MDATPSLYPELFAPPLAAPADLQLRPAAQADTAWLHANAYTDKTRAAFRVYADQLLSWQQSGRGCWLIAERNGRTVGCGELLIYPHGAELANLFVVPPHRGRGVGTALLIVLSRIARHLEQTALEIGVHEENVRAMSLYQRLGFAVERSVVLPGGETAVILRKPL